MSANRDRLAKLVLEEALDPFGVTQREVEIEPGYLQRGDFLFTPIHPVVLEQWPGYLQLMGKMVGEISMFEFSSNPPDEGEALDFHCKQMNLRNRRRLKGEQPEMPRLWTLSAGKPVKALSSLSAEPDESFPEGFYRMAPWTKMGFVVLPELPRTRQTVVLRMLGTSRLRQDALDEIAAIPDSDGEQAALFTMVAALRHAIDRDTLIPQEEKESFMTAARLEFERFKTDLVNQSAIQASQEAMLVTLEARGMPLDDMSRQRILSCQDLPTLKRWIAQAATAPRIEDVLA